MSANRQHRQPRRHRTVPGALPIALALAAWLLTGVSQAECGGATDCIAVSVDPGTAPVHGSALTSAPLAFGRQALATTSAVRTIQVAAVGGGSGSATLTAITLSGADAAEFALAGGNCTTGNPSLLQGGAACTVAVTFSPVTAGFKNATVQVASASIARTVPLSGFGDDGSFPDPGDDPVLQSLLRAQIDTARRFADVQTAHLQRRLETLRAAPASVAENETTAAALLARLADTATLSLEQALGVAGGRADYAADPGWWSAGDLRFGTRDQTPDGASMRFSSEGLSFGFDRRLGPALALGVGVGLAQSETDVGDAGTRESADYYSLSGYLGYAPARALYLNALLGYGVAQLDTGRYDAFSNAIARSSRDATQWFASLAAGYEWRREALLLSPYARFDLASHEFAQTTESGSLSNLHYRKHQVDTTKLSLGLRAEAPHDADFGWVLPHLRVELQFAEESGGDAEVRYRDDPLAENFVVSPDDADREALLFGVGADLYYRNGLRLALEYQGLHTSGASDSQAFTVTLAGDLDGKPPAWDIPVQLLQEPLRIEAGYALVENVNLAPSSRDALSDRYFELGVRKARRYPWSEHSQFVLSGAVTGRNQREHDGLDRVSAGAQGEWQYRPSAAFGAPTYGLSGQLALDAYDSSLRSGARLALELSLHKRLTDRIAVFAALDQRARETDHDVFDTQDAGLRFALDYSLGEADALRFGGEYRSGDTVSSTPGSNQLAAIADAVEADDAWHDEALLAYRYEAETLLWTLGYTRALGPRDSVDIALRHIDSEPAEPPPGAGSASYLSDEFSVFYIVFF